MGFRYRDVSTLLEIQPEVACGQADGAPRRVSTLLEIQPEVACGQADGAPRRVSTLLEIQHYRSFYYFRLPANGYGFNPS